MSSICILPIALFAWTALLRHEACAICIPATINTSLRLMFNGAWVYCVPIDHPAGDKEVVRGGLGFAFCSAAPAARAACPGAPLPGVRLRAPPARPARQQQAARQRYPTTTKMRRLHQGKRGWMTNPSQRTDGSALILQPLIRYVWIWK